jgi:adenylate cyclase
MTDGKQRLAAILAADAAGYSRLMAADERATVAALDSCRGVFRRLIESHQGRVVDMAGDSVLALFETASGAVHAALAIQKELEGADRKCDLRFRVGVHLGDVLEKSDGTVYGDGINVAARLQSLAAPGEVAVSDVVQIAVRGRVEAMFVDRGEQAVKNIPTPLHWYCAAAMQARHGATDPHSRTAEQVGGLPSIAILPFRTASTDPEQASFADGLRIDIQGALVKIAGMTLIAPATTNAYRNKEVAPQQAASEMGVRYLLEGFVQKSGDQARITLSLLDGASGQVIWTERYDRVLDETFGVQDEITERVVTALDVRLMSGEQARVWRKTIKHPRAREHFYRGIHEFFKGQKEANAAARESFEQVVRLVPQTSLGPTMVAFTHWMDAFRGWASSPKQSFDMAAQWAERAMAMEDADGQAHTVMGHIHLLRREHDTALEVVEQAVALRPSCTNANAHLANILYYCGRPAEAADRMRQAMRFSPAHPPWFKVVLASSCKEIRQWNDAGQVAKQVIRAKPDDVDARLVLIETCLGAGDGGAAREFAGEIRKLQPGFSLSQWAERQPYRDPAVLERIVAALREAGLS